MNTDTTPDSIAVLSDNLRQRLTNGMSLDDAVDAMDMDVAEVDRLARASDEHREAMARLRQVATETLQNLNSTPNS